MRGSISTPWGPAQSVRAMGAHVSLIDTAGHGGLMLDAHAQSKIPAGVATALMHGKRWAEEDCELPIVLSLLTSAGVVPPDTLWTSSERLHRRAAETAQNHERYQGALAHLEGAQAPTAVARATHQREPAPGATSKQSAPPA